jgi:hypothetical protein
MKLLLVKNIILDFPLIATVSCLRMITEIHTDASVNLTCTAMHMDFKLQNSSFCSSGYTRVKPFIAAPNVRANDYNISACPNFRNPSSFH